MRAFRSGGSLGVQLVRSGVGSAAVKAVNVLLGLAVAVVLARALGPGGYGIYAFAFALASILAIPVQAGLPTLVIRETAKAQNAENWPLIRGLWAWAGRTVLLFSISLIGIVGLGLWVTQQWVDADRFGTLMAALFLVPAIAMGRVVGGAVRGLQRVVLGQLPDNVLRPAVLVGTVGIYLLCVPEAEISPALAMIIHAGAAAISFGLGAWMLWGVRPSGMRSGTTVLNESSSWRRAALPLAMIGGLQLVNKQTDILMLGVIRPDDEVGVYRVVVQMAMLVLFGLQAINQVLQPQLARLYEQGDYRRLQVMITRSSQVILCAALIPAILFATFGGPILFWLFGHEYMRGEAALTILVFGQLVQAAVGSAAALLNMTGHERDTLRGVGIAAVANIALNLFLIPHYGMEGAAFATACSLVIWSTLLAYTVYRRIGVVSSAIPLPRWVAKRRDC